MNVNLTTPGRDLYNRVRAGFILKGSSLTAWCNANGVKQQNALHCLIGSWDGPKSKELRKKMVFDSGITSASSVFENS